MIHLIALIFLASYLGSCQEDPEKIRATSRPSSAEEIEDNPSYIASKTSTLSPGDEAKSITVSKTTLSFGANSVLENAQLTLGVLDEAPVREELVALGDPKGDIVEMTFYDKASGDIHSSDLLADSFSFDQELSGVEDETSVKFVVITSPGTDSESVQIIDGAAIELESLSLTSLDLIASISLGVTHAIIWAMESWIIPASVITISNSEVLTSSGSNSAGEIVAPSETTVVEQEAESEVGLSLIPGNRRLSIEYNAGCVISNANDLYCWGEATSGIPGNGNTTDNVLVPTKLIVEHKWSSISVSTSHACGISLEGELFCRGKEANGAVDHGLSESAVPTRVGERSDYVLVDTALTKTCALAESGDLSCWGQDTNGSLGNGDSEEDEREPTLVVGGLKFSTFAAGEDQVCAIDGVGQLYCWGNNVYGALALGDRNLESVDEPTKSPSEETWVELMSANSTVCGRTTSDDILCWGYDNPTHILGNSDSQGDIDTPTKVFGDVKYAALGDMSKFACSISSLGELYCWGSGETAGFAPNKDKDPAAPAKIGDDKWKAVSTAVHAVCGIRIDDSVMCWGNQLAGAIGNSIDEYSDVLTPQFIFSVE